LVAPAKHGGYRQFSTSGDIQSGRALLPFWAERLAVWFDLAETQEKIKFCHVISQLDHRYATEVDDISTSPPDQYPYATQTAQLVRRLPPSRGQRIRQLLTPEEMGDRKPSNFLRHLRSLASDVPGDFLRSIWSSRLLPNVKAILAGQPEGSLDAAARCAECISEVALQPELASVGPPPEITALLQGSRTSPARWQHSALSRTVFVPTSGNLA
jgi:hypothetical protein